MDFTVTFTDTVHARHAAEIVLSSPQSKLFSNLLAQRAAPLRSRMEGKLFYIRSEARDLRDNTQPGYFANSVFILATISGD